MQPKPCVYILASGFRGTLYVGATAHLVQRVRKHRQGAPGAFTGRYAVYRLVHFEVSPDMAAARARERQLKRWHRQWKINLIEEKNPHWDDLAVGLGFKRLTDERRAGRKTARAEADG
jgi:putative endonuclease